MEIIPFTGFDDIRFGMSKDDIIDEMGIDVEEVVDEHEDGSKSHTLLYDEEGCAFIFSSDDDYLLGTITLYAPDFLLEGVELIGVSEKKFLEKAKDIVPDLELEDEYDDVDSKDYSSELLGLSIWIQDGIVDSITLFPKYAEDNNTILWPED